MSISNRRIDIVVRILVVIALIFGCFDSALLYRNWQKNKTTTETTETEIMDAIEDINEDPSQMVTVNDQQYEPIYEEITGMDYDDAITNIIPPIIKDDDIHISATLNPSIISISDTLHISIDIQNNSQETKKGLIFYDYLNKTLRFSQSVTKGISFDNETNAVTYQIQEIVAGDTLNLAYDLKINNDIVSEPNVPQTWVHSVYIKTNDETNKSGYQADLIWILDKTSQSNKTASILSSAGGWAVNDGVSIYAPEEALSSDSVLVIDQRNNTNDGPELQFGLNLFSLEDQTLPDNNSNESISELNAAQTETFSNPVYLQVDFDSLGELSNLPPGTDPYIATFDDEAKVWVKVPLENINYEENTIAAYASHFSVWGAGLGSSLPQNGANVLLFDQPYVSLFTGRASYNLPISTPSGRADFSPSVSLSYSSRTVDGVLGDIQAPWVGMGWNIDAIEIVRKITTDENGFGYDNDFALTINGTVYTLVEDTVLKGRFHTEDASFYYIQRHNPALGNDDGVQNTTKEWWEVISPSGIHYRLGWNDDAEQLSMMPGYYCMTGYPCIQPSGAYTSLGYAGTGVDVVAMRWRVDRIYDTHNNFIQYNYQEESKNVGSIQFDHASYLSTINYTGHLNSDGSIDSSIFMPYQIRFNVEDRPETMGDNPSGRVYDWDNFENKRLDSIEIIYHCASGSSCEDTRSGTPVSVSDVILQTYDFAYDVHQIPSADGTQILSEVNISAGGYTENNEAIEYVSLPAITFDYTDKANQAENNPLIEHYIYPRLTSVDNGFGAEMTFEYERDNRAETYWYNYRVKNILVDNGFDSSRKISYTYTSPTYIDNEKELLGFADVQQFSYDFDQTTVLSNSRHVFSTTYPDFGKELRTDIINPANSLVHQRVQNTWSGNNTGVPSGVNFRFISQVRYYQNNGSSLVQTGSNKFTYNPYTGNLTEKRTYKGEDLYTIEHYEYGINSDTDVYITDRVLRSTLTDGNGVISADTRYMYDNSTSGVPTIGDVTLVQNITGVNTSATVDTGYAYDAYGNVIETVNYASYGTAGEIPTYNAASDQKNQVVYDSTYHMLPVSTINPLGYTTTNQILFSLSAAKSTTDANQETITYTYDGLGRQLTSTANGFEGYSETGYAGYTSKTIYPTTYQQDAATGKNYHVLQMQIWDPIGENEQGVATPGYRSIWGIYDAQGVIRQTQMLLPDGSVQLVDVSLNAQGLTDKESEPHIANTSTGSYAAIDWSSTPHSTNTYDFMQRITNSTAPDGRSSQYSYPFYAKETIDAAGHKKRYEYDYLDRLIKVLEYTGTTSNYELYSSMSYAYDVYSNLISVTDQEGSQTKLGYDWLGRKLSIKSPDMGFWSYDYNALGSLTRQNDARNETVCLYYDQLNRLTGKAYAQSGNCLSIPSSSDLAVSFGFGDGTAGKPYGYRTSMQDETGSTSWNYANSARTITETRQISGRSYQFTTYSDYLGRVFQENDPGEQVNYHYDITGRVVGMDAGQDQDLIQLAYNTFSQIDNISFQQNGHQITRENTYNSSTHRLDAFKIYNGDTWSEENALMNFSYQYDLLDNITSITDDQLDDEYTFTYDDVNRLVSAQSVHDLDYNYKQDYEYDATGNILSVSNWRYTYYPAGIYEDDFEGISLNENWSAQTNTSASGETEHISGIVDSELTFYFTGTGIGYVRKVGPDQGMVDVYIDAELVDQIDNYAEIESYQELAVIPVEAGEHRLDLKVSASQNENSSGATINVDYLEVFNELPAFTATPTFTYTPSQTLTPTYTSLSAGTYQENDGMINFTGAWQENSAEYYAGNTQVSTNSSGASFTFLFAGNHFDLVHSAGPDHGFAEVCIDADSLNESCENIDFYDADILAQVNTGYEVPYGMHFVRVSHTGTQNENATDSIISIDQLSIISDSPTETPAPTDTPTITFTPSETLIPSDTPIPSDTAVASETPVESNTPEFSVTPEFSSTPETSETLQESYTPEFNTTPSPTDETTEPGNTPETSETLQESNTPEFSTTPLPTLDGTETFTYTPDGSETATDTPTVEFSQTPDDETETPQPSFTYTPSPSLTNSPTNTATITNTPVSSNVAPGKSVSQSSILSIYPATLAIDGDYTNYTHTELEQNGWWQIDLGSFHQIDSINIWNRLAVPERLSDYYIIVSNRPFTNTTLEYGINQPDFIVKHMTATAGRPTTVEINNVGRYIRVQLAGTNYLSISEFDVMGYQLPNNYIPITRPTNLASGKTVSQSSLLSVFPATLAIDGDFSNYSHTEQDTHGWWQVDLGSFHQIDSINIWNRIAVPERLSDYYVFISDNPFTNEDLEYTIHQPGVFVIHMNTTPGRPTSIPINTVGRYIRIQLAGTNYLSIAEFEVFGEQLPNDYIPASKPVNLALSSSAIQSSQLGDYDASNAIDGITNNMTHTQITANPWVQVDLNYIADIEKIFFWNRDGAESRNTNYYVFVSDNPFSSDNVTNTINQPGVWTYHDTGTAGKPTTINVNRSGKYVRIQLAGTNYLSVKEIIIQGFDINAPATATFTLTPSMTPTSTITPTPTNTFTPSLTPTYELTSVPTEEAIGPRLIASNVRRVTNTYEISLGLSNPGGGDDRILIVGIDGDNPITTMQVRYSSNGPWVPLTLLSSNTVSNGKFHNLYYTQNIPTSASSIDIYAGKNGRGGLTISALLFDQVDPINPIGDSIRKNSGIGTNIHTDIYAYPDELAVGFATAWYFAETSMSPSSGQTAPIRFYQYALGYKLGSTSMDWTMANSREWSQIVFTLRPNRTMEDTNSRFDYTGAWDTASNPAFSHNTEHIANSIGEEVHFHFYGNQLKLYYAKDTNRGIAQVCIDEGNATEICQNIDQYNNSFLAKHLTTFNVTQGGHNVVMRYTGTHNQNSGDFLIGLDRISVAEFLPTITPTNTMTHTPTITNTPTLTPTSTPSLTPTYELTSVPTEHKFTPRFLGFALRRYCDTNHQTFNITMPEGGADRFVLLGIQTSSALSEVKYIRDGAEINVPLLLSKTTSDGTIYQVHYIQNPPVGETTFKIRSTYYATVNTTISIFDRVDPTNPFGRVEFSSGNGTTIHTDIYANPDELVVGFAGNVDDNIMPVAASGQVTNFSSHSFLLGYQEGSSEMDWSLSSARNWAQTLIALKPNHTLEDTDSRFDYSGEWDTASNASFSGGTEHVSNALGEDVNFHFYGNQLNLYYAKDSNRGIAQVCIDEGTAAEICQDIDQYSENFAAKRLSTISVTQGGHNVVMRYTGTRNQDADGFIVGLDKISVAEFIPTVTPTSTYTFTPTNTPTPYSIVPQVWNSAYTNTSEEKATYVYCYRVPAGAENTLLLIQVAGSVTSVTYGDQTLTHLASTIGNGGIQSHIYYLKNPPSGQYIYGRINRNRPEESHINIVTLKDVNLTNTFGQVSGIYGFGNAISESVSSDINDLVVDFYAVGIGGPITITPGLGQQRLMDCAYTRRSQSGISVKQNADEMSYSLSWDLNWVHQVVVVHSMGYATPTPTLTPTSTYTPTSTSTLTPTPTPLDWPTPIVQTPQTAGVYQEVDPAWHYTGFWESVSSSGDSSGAHMEGTQAWASAQMSFTGNQLTYTFRKGPAYGIAELYVGPADGSSLPVKVASIDQYAASVAAAQTETITLPESTEPRILIIRHADRKNPNSSGHTINLDAVTIGTEAEITLAPTRSPTPFPATITATVNPPGINLIRTDAIRGYAYPSVTHSYYVPELGNNRILIVGLGFSGPGYNYSTSDDLLSITYGGQPLQLAAQADDLNVTQMWYLTNPPVGWHDLVVTFNEQKYFGMGIATFNGVDQFEPIRYFSVNEQYSRMSFTAVNCPTGDLALSLFTGGTGTLDRPAEAQIPEMTQIIEDGDGNSLIMSTRPGVGWTYMEYSWDNGLRNNDIILVSLKRYMPGNVTSIPTNTATPGDSPTPTPALNTATALPTSGMFTQHYHYDAGQPHAVSGVDREFRQDKFTYDVNGNQTTRLVDGVNYTLAYDEENRIETVTDTQASQTWTFHYDGNGTRVRQINPDGSQLLLLNGGRYHVEIAADTTESTTRYYSIAGQRPAMRNNDGSINYLLGDHLGSVSTVVDASGEIVSQSRYLPFGELLWEDGASPTDYTFTGQRSLSDIGLMDYNARFYDPMLGRFTSPDSTIPDLSNKFDYNRYTYVRNNPTYYIDPNGENPIALVLFIIGMTIYMSQVPSDEVQLNPEETGDPAVQLIGISFMGIGGDLLASTIDCIVYGGDPTLIPVNGYILGPSSSMIDNVGMVDNVVPEMDNVANSLDNTANVADNLPSKKSSYEIGMEAEKAVGEEFEGIIAVKQRPVDSNTRRYDGYCISDPDKFVEIKTSTRGTVYGTKFNLKQADFDQQWGLRTGKFPTWIFVNVGPSKPLENALNYRGIPWETVKLNLPQ